MREIAVYRVRYRNTATGKIHIVPFTEDELHPKMKEIFNHMEYFPFQGIAIMKPRYIEEETEE